VTGVRPSRRPSSPHEIVVGEHENVEIDDALLSGVGNSRLERLKKIDGVISVTERRKGWSIRTNAVVGVLDLDSVRVIIKPKIAIDGERLIVWLSYAAGSHLHNYHEGYKPHKLSETGYDAADLIVEALIDECRKLLRSGLRREYQRERSIASQVRGRLDISAQATRQYGQADRFHVSEFRQVVATWENEICGLALSRAVEHAADPSLSSAAASLVGRFPLPTDEGRAIDKLRKAAYTRLNVQYRPAHAWARVLLNTGGVADLLCTSGFRGRTALLNMNVMWEMVVRRMAADAVAPLHGRVVPNNDNGLAIRVHGDLRPSGGGEPKPFQPDCVVRVGDEDSGFHVPIDAKYYAYNNRRVSSTNVQQMMTYVSGYCDNERRAAVLVHPSAAGPTQRTLEVRNARPPIGRIYVIGIDVNAGPQEGAERLRQVVQGL
jgi:5-methylcytosine-specific restriction enzyme subunit McrC